MVMNVTWPGWLLDVGHLSSERAVPVEVQEGVEVRVAEVVEQVARLALVGADECRNAAAGACEAVP